MIKNIISPSSLPDALLESVRNQRVILFLGAGTSMESKDQNGNSPPSGSKLRDLIGTKFFGKSLQEYDLALLSEIAIQEHNETLVFQYIKSILEPFEPSPAHFLIPTFRWRAIATTNYDVLIDSAYARCNYRLQTIVPIVKDTDPIEELLQQKTDPLLFLKLHGCLNHLYDHDIPLVLSNEHYSRYNKHRKHLYNRLKSWAHESTFVFCGYKLADPHIRKIIYDLEEDGVKRPAWYLVAPNIADYESKFWASLNVHVIDATFGSFMASLNSNIPIAGRKLVVAQETQSDPIRSHFIINEELPKSLKSALVNDLVHVHSSMEIEPQIPKRFYQGLDTGWGAIVQHLDIDRKPVADLLLDAVIDPHTTRIPQLFVFTGPAGSGKTIALKRAAWEAATSFGVIALWLTESGALSDEILSELHRLTGERIFIFVDRLSLRVDSVERILQSAKQKKLPLTIVGAERLNEWNVYCEYLQQNWQPTELPIFNLSVPDIKVLLDLLTRHNALGLLADKPREEQIKAFEQRAERQLLVALHEATLGKQFEEIVYDEYRRVVPEQARQLYLDICTMHQHNVSARAGTISRISGIRFAEYKSKFFAPLEKIVLFSKNPYTGDVHYRARHTRVAQLVFQQACTNDHERADQLIRIVSSLDIGYSVDQKVLKEITRGHRLAEDIKAVDFGREIYRAALETAPENPFLLQQWAIFELNHPEGEIKEADRLAREAANRDQNSNSIKHTLAVVCRRFANKSASPVAKEQYRRVAHEYLNQMNVKNDPYVQNLKSGIAIDELRDLANNLDEHPTDADLSYFHDKVNKTESTLSHACQLHPDNAELLNEEARLSQLLSQDQRAVRALERSWQAGARSSTVAVRLVQHYVNENNNQKAEEVLQSALTRNPDDKLVHLEMAKHLIRSEPDHAEVINQHFARSYAPNDDNFEARHLHAQYLFFTGKPEDAQTLFSMIDRIAPVPFRRRAASEDSIVSNKLGRYQGTIVTLKATMAFIRCSSYPADIFAHANDTENNVWRSLQNGDGITFKLRFNRSGPVALQIELQN